MTVAELIEKLKEFPDYYNIEIQYDSWGYPVSEVKLDQTLDGQANHAVVVIVVEG